VNWGTHDAPRIRRSEPPAPQLVEAYWRAVGPSGKELSCGLYRTAAGLELRCGYQIDELLRSTRMGLKDDARYTAALWLLVVLSNGSFDVLESHVGDELNQLRTALDSLDSHIQ
jgi:hypothetical protein